MCNGVIEVGGVQRSPQEAWAIFSLSAAPIFRVHTEGVGRAKAIIELGNRA